MKTAYIIFLLLLVSTITFAQNSVTVSVGGGRSFSSAALKQDASIGDGTQAGADVFVPFLQKGSSGKFALGILAGAYYQSAKHLSPAASGLQSKYKLYSGDPEITNTSSNSQAFAFSAGLQADLTFGRITLSPSVSGGYLTSTQDVSTQHTQVMVNGTTQKVVLSASPEEKTRGLIMTPQLKVGYHLTRNLSVYAAGSVNAGPNTTRTQYDLIPAGGFNDNNTYEATQLASGKLALDGSSKEAAYRTTSIQAGLSWSFGKSKGASRVGKTKSGGGGAAAASYAATGRAVAPSDTPRPARQTPNTSFGQRVTAPADAPSAGKQTQGATFGEKVNQGLHAAGSSLVLTPGNPIGGIIVKGGKNPGGGSQMTITTDNNGGFEFTIREAGNYRFVLTAPDESTAQGRSISEKGVKRSDNTPQGRSVSEKGVKRSDNTAQGRSISEKGVKRSDNTPQDKSISEQGVNKSDNPIFTNDGQSGDNPMPGTGAFAARPGQPIKGVIVRGGKKPGGNMITITTNGNGEIDMNGLKAGKYKFIVTAP